MAATVAASPLASGKFKGGVLQNLATEAKKPRCTQLGVAEDYLESSILISANHSFIIFIFIYLYMKRKV